MRRGPTDLPSTLGEGADVNPSVKMLAYRVWLGRLPIPRDTGLAISSAPSATATSWSLLGNQIVEGLVEVHCWDDMYNVDERVEKRVGWVEVGNAERGNT